MSPVKRAKIHAALDGLTERNLSRHITARTARFRFKIITAIREGKLSTLEEARRLIQSLRGASATEETIAGIDIVTLAGGPTLIFTEDKLAGYVRSDANEPIETPADS